jgi:hypothetical protein
LVLRFRCIEMGNTIRKNFCRGKRVGGSLPGRESKR